MKKPPALVEVRPQVNRPAGETLEKFVHDLGKRWKPGKRSTLPTIEDFARALWTFLDLYVPVRHRLCACLPELGIDLIGDPETANADGTFLYNGDTQRWEIHIPYAADLGESLFILHELFELIFWRAYHTVDWWPEWMQQTGILDPHDVADKVARVVILPKHTFRERAQECGLNIWTLAKQFQAWPGDCFNAITRFMRFPFPYLQVSLGYPHTPQPQSALTFQDRGYKSEVNAKAFKDAHGLACVKWPEMAAARAAFPKKHTTIELTGLLERVVREHRPIMETTAFLLAKRLPKPVCVVVRPNTFRRTNMYLQAVPLGFEEVLMDDELLAQQER